MANPDERDGGDGGRPISSNEADLSERLKTLDARLGQASERRAAEKREPSARSTSDQRALGQAFRLSAEFVSGVVAGGILGWLVDRLFGSSPWGLIVCLILGFCAGMLNLMRSAGMVKPARHDRTR